MRAKIYDRFYDLKRGDIICFRDIKNRRRTAIVDFPPSAEMYMYADKEDCPIDLIFFDNMDTLNYENDESYSFWYVNRNITCVLEDAAVFMKRRTDYTAGNGDIILIKIRRTLHEELTDEWGIEPKKIILI